VPEFDVFKNRWEIKGTLVLETPLHIGAGQSDGGGGGISGTVLTYRNDHGQDLPYIPGSSLKGVLRSTLERLLRTFSEDLSCRSVVGDVKEPCCGKCVVCGMFGSPDGGASITVRDAFISEEWLSQKHNHTSIVAEQMHCATKYDGDLRPKMDTTGNVKTGAWPQQRVVVGAEFKFSISLDNADEIHIGYILLALDEFNRRRAFLGSGTSRGLGVVSIKPFPPEIIKITLDTGVLASVPVAQPEIQRIIKAAKKNLGAHPSTKSSGLPLNEVDFSVYTHAYEGLPSNGTPPSGCVVAELEITTAESFRMAGIKEITVTSGGIPYIPGSTIKGFLRHTFIKQKNFTGRPLVDWIYRVFGKVEVEERENVTRETPVHWSHLLVSDAFPCDSIGSEDGQIPQEIPTNTRLRMWCVFNNMEGQDIKTIMDLLTNPAGITVTGRTIAENDLPRHHNKVRMALKNPPGYQTFRVATYLKDE